MDFEEHGFSGLNEVKSSTDFKFSENTTYGLGGQAKIAYFPKTEQEAIAVLEHLNSIREKYVILGNGSNVLASDSFFNGAVISTKYLNAIKYDGNTLYCESGVTVSKLLKFCLDNGIGGYEYLAGIPATLGGLALMNGGIPSNHIGENIISVRLFDGKMRLLANKKCNFGNKYSTMRDINALILGLNLSICAVSREAVQEKINFYLRKRSNQPKGKNCGCVFKNPDGESAGKLIDQAGLKGLTVGGAEVSDFHANFIINNGACSNDVYTLIQEVKRRVFENSHIRLSEEVVYIGEFNDFNS